MSINEEKELWVATQPDGKVLTSWCSCMAGAFGCCNLIIATLYKVEYANSQGFCSPACTSNPCGWNKPTKTIIEPKNCIHTCSCQKKTKDRTSCKFK